MNAAEADSLTMDADWRVVRKKFSRISVTWKIACIQIRAANKEKIVSSIFRFSKWYWELIVHFRDSAYINNINLKCVDENSTSVFTVYLKSGIIRGDSGCIVREIPAELLHFCKRESSSKIIPSTNICIDKLSSIEVWLYMCLEENIEPEFQTIINEKKEELLRGCTSKLFSDFGKLYENHQLSDVTLKLGEEEFPAHKSVLSARSKVFAAMFEHDMKENLQGIVDLVQMEPKTVQDMLRYIYCAKVRDLSAVEALNLYVAAERYDLKELTTICREAVVSDISVDNVFDIAAVADIHNDELLIKEVKSFMAKKGKNLIKNAKWKDVFSQNPVLLAKMLEWSLSAQ